MKFNWRMYPKGSAGVLQPLAGLQAARAGPRQGPSQQDTGSLALLVFYSSNPIALHRLPESKVWGPQHMYLKRNNVTDITCASSLRQLEENTLSSHIQQCHYYENLVQNQNQRSEGRCISREREIPWELSGSLQFIDLKLHFFLLLYASTVPPTEY